ncbi:lysylphosphatidylglycerol synthase transmembrane domain-containing protein [Legionella fairfieldensis]|uniref:lysylphosphatidylglycerol synthase transmembrane domain-containing protein n=1 Tax=Legionella fairfieldensis TaxID=45064 RepID=UPI000684CA41|nr:lysylphosphatidylglycerol synthase transmembrane domain-containing protein [Legionella fairfieldensis]
MSDILTNMKISFFKKTQKYIRYITGAFITIACLTLIARQINGKTIVGAIRQFEWAYLLIGLSFLILGYCCRIIRWAWMLRTAKATIKITSCVAPFLGSIAMNNLLPLRCGDLMRAFVFPAAIGISKATATSTVVMERLIDLLTVLVCLTFGLWIVKEIQLPEWVANLLISLGAVGACTLILVLFFSKKLAGYFYAVSLQTTQSRWATWFEAIYSVLNGFVALARTKTFLNLLSFSLLIWLSDAGLFWSLLKGFKLEVNLPMAMIVMAITALSTLIPSLPGYIGPFHLASFTAISLLGAIPEKAASFAILAHLALWLPTTLAGSISLLITPQLLNSVTFIRRN